MPMFATIADIENRYPGTLTDAQIARLPTLLADASTVVATYTRQVFVEATTTENIRPIGDRIRMRQSPVTGVTGVALVDTLQTSQLLTLPMGAWMWDGGQEIWIGAVNTVINLPDEVTYLLQYQTPLMQVVYSHGYPAIPDPVVTVVCSMILRVLDLPGPTSISSATLGGLGYQMTASAEGGVLGMTDAEMTLLAPYRRAATTMELR